MPTKKQPSKPRNSANKKAGRGCQERLVQHLPFGRGNPEIEAKRLAMLREANSKPRSPETIEKLKASLKSKWASGTRKANPKSSYLKAGENIRKAYAEGRVKMRPKEERIANARKGGKTMTPLKLEKIRANAKARKGMPGTGGCASGEGNAHAHHWIIRSPRGEIYKFTNLAEWARNNEHLFLPDERPSSKKPLCKRIVTGIGMLFEVNGRCCSYRGWTAVSRLELVNGGGDLLGRDISLLNAGGMAPATESDHGK